MTSEEEDMHMNLPIEVEHCPNCPDQGWYAVCDNYTGEPVQEQCEFCYTTPNSAFNIYRMENK